MPESDEVQDQDDDIQEFFDDDAEPVKRAKPRREDGRDEEAQDHESLDDDNGFEPTGPLTVGLALVYGGLCVGVLGIIVAACAPYLTRNRPDLFPWLIGSQLLIILSFFLCSLLLCIGGRVASLAGVTMQSVGVVFYVCILLSVLADIVGLCLAGAIVTSLVFKFGLPQVFVQVGEYSPIITFAGHTFFVVFLWRLTVLVHRPRLGILALLALASWVAFPVTVVLWKKATIGFFYAIIAVCVSTFTALITYGNTLSYLRSELSSRE